MVFFIERLVYKRSRDVHKYIMSATLKNCNVKVNMREVSCKIINAFRSQDYYDIAAKIKFKFRQVVEG